MNEEIRRRHLEVEADKRERLSTDSNPLCRKVTHLLLKQDSSLSAATHASLTHFLRKSPALPDPGVTAAGPERDCHPLMVVIVSSEHQQLSKPG